jgi:hypothetical protein
MVSMTALLRPAAVALFLVFTLDALPTHAAEGFPFGFEMTLEAGRQFGSKRLPTLEIGDNGETRVELWCKGGKGQFSVAEDTVIFVAGPMEERSCSAAQAQADDELITALGQAATWKRQGDYVTFIGPKTLRFLMNTN